MGTAREIIRYKKERGGLIEVVIGLLSDPLPGGRHPYKIPPVLRFV